MIVGGKLGVGAFAVASVLAAIADPRTVCAQPASMVADIGQGEPRGTGFFDSLLVEGTVVPSGSSAYFFADDQIHGRELWVTDGTAAGSHIVADLCVGSCSGSGSGLTSWQGSLFFWGWDGESPGGGPWRSDGTGAVPVKLAAGLQTSNPRFLGLGAFLYFVADESTHGAELWRTDGTATGTELFEEIRAGATGSWPYLLAASASQIFFVADDGSQGDTLWRTDGTTAGTYALPSVFALTTTARGALLPDGTFVVASFPPSGSYEVWHTDGTLAGTSLLHSFASGASTAPSYFSTAGGFVFFACGGDLWRTDGTVAGTIPVTTIPDAGTITTPLTGRSGGPLYFGASTVAQGNELWKTDGTSAGTQLVEDIDPGPASGVFGFTFASSSAVFPDGRLFFYAQDGSHGFEPWITDGTAAGTSMLADIAAGPGFSTDILWPPAMLNGNVLFRAFDLPRATRLWRSDGTSAGTQAIVQPSQQSSSLGWPFFGQFTKTAHGVVFFADDHQYGVQPWGANVDGLGAHLIADLSPYTDDWIVGENAGHAYFATYSASSGQSQIAVTDGESAQLLQPVNGGMNQGSAVFDGAFFYLTYESDGSKLWRIDGSSPPTLVYQWQSAQSISLSPGRTKLWIWVSESGGFRSLWDTDGTAGGTATHGGLNDLICAKLRGDESWILVRGPWPSGPNTSHVDLLTANSLTTAAAFPSKPVGCHSFGDDIALFIDDGSHGYEPWITDGSAAGTQLIADLAPGPLSSTADSPLAGFDNGRFYFLADDGVHGREMWASDGTAAGTLLLADIAPGAASGGASLVASIGQRAYFTADDGVHGRELWSSDGTSGGTLLTLDLFPGSGGSIIQGSGTSDGILIFSALDGVHGRELFATNGFPSGTKLIQDIAPGAESSSPTGFAAIGPNVYFYADDATHGFEPWKLPRRALANAVPAALDFYTSTPCRLIDTRTSAPLAAGVPVTLPVVGQCGIPAEAQAIAVNVTTVGATADGAIALYPADDPGPGPGLAPVVAGRTRATNAILRISLDDVGSLTALAQLPAGAQMHLVVDVSGYFAP